MLLLFIPEQPMVVSLLPQAVALQPVRPALLPQVFEKGSADGEGPSALAGIAAANRMLTMKTMLIITITDLPITIIPLPPLAIGYYFLSYDGASGQSRTDDQLFTKQLLYH